VGATIALVLGAGPRRQAWRPNANAAVLAGAFGALIGGIIGDGVPHAASGAITVLSLVGAAVGALVFCWAVRAQASDVEP
jgi:hypothetical protein